MSASHAKLEIQVRQLTETVATLKPQAELAEQLQRDMRLAEKTGFFERQLREGKLAPRDRAFWERMYDKDQPEVEKYFAEKKPDLKLAERGFGDQGEEQVLGEQDARQVLADKATRRAQDKGIGFLQAMEQIKAEEPELTERVRALYGPEGLSR